MKGCTRTAYARRTRAVGHDPRRRLCVTASYGQDPKQPVPAPRQPSTIRKTGALRGPPRRLGVVRPTSQGDLTDVVVSREDIVQVKVDPTNPKAAALTGRTTGLSQLTLSFKDTPKRTYDIVVQPDLNLLRNIIKRTVPTAQVEVSARHRQRDHHQRVRDQPAGRGRRSARWRSTPPAVTRTTSSTPSRSAACSRFRSTWSSLGQPATGPEPRLRLRRPGGNVSQVRQPHQRPARSVGGADAGVSGGNLLFQETRADPVLRGPAGPADRGHREVPGRAAGRDADRPPRVLPGRRSAGGRQRTSGITGPGVQLVPFGTELEVVPIVYGNGMIWLEINPRVTSVNTGLGDHDRRHVEPRLRRADRCGPP